MSKIIFLISSVLLLNSCDQNSNADSSDSGGSSSGTSSISDADSSISDADELMGFSSEVHGTLEDLGYFSEKDLKRKKLILLEVVGQIAPNFEYSLNVTQYSFLVEELKSLYPSSYAKSVGKNGKSVDLFIFLEDVIVK